MTTSELSDIKFAGSSDTPSIFRESNDPIIEELNSFSKLDEGWSYGEGGPIKYDVIEKARRLYTVGSYIIERVNVFPGIDGSILVVFYRGEFSVEFSINKNLELDVTIEKGIGFDFSILLEESNIGIKRAESILRKLKDPEWKLSDSFIKNITTLTPKDFVVSHSETLQTMVVYPSLISDVLPNKSKKMKQFVTTS